MSRIECIIKDLKGHPQCPHGPTLLFSRCTSNGGEKKNFFACAASRDRKQCSFFLWEKDINKFNMQKQHFWKVQQEKLMHNINHRKRYILLNQIKQLNDSKRMYCSTCDMWIVPENKIHHQQHNSKNGINDNEISYPTTFLKPLENDKKEAQYFFKNSSVISIINIIQNLQIKNILCIGAPRIHETLVTDYPNIRSLLLDLDNRYMNFFGPLEFCWYNLFNHYFFLPSTKEVYEEFLKLNKNNDDLLVIIDPPFGGRTELIAETVKKIENDFKNINNANKQCLSVFLFLPYFMEPQVVNSFNNFQMCDLMIDYENHVLFNEGLKGRKYGSPVRFFTNIPLNKINLSKEIGYKFCDECNRWVYENNNHCKLCKGCTSKDGRTYVHCEKCERCVKPTWSHCNHCEKCHQIDHQCGDIKFTQTCFHCKKEGHKKRECPDVSQRTKLKRKRK